MDTKNKIFTVIGSTALVLTVAVGGYTLFATKDGTASRIVSAARPVATTSQNNTNATTSSTTTLPTASTGSTYKNGTYTASRNYRVPGDSQNTISATITISGGKITAVKTSDDFADDTSSYYISGFEQAVGSDASGQSLASYNPSQIGGASLTTAAFYDVLDAVRSQAAA